MNLFYKSEYATGDSYSSGNKNFSSQEIKKFKPNQTNLKETTIYLIYQ